MLTLKYLIVLAALTLAAPTSALAQGPAAPAPAAEKTVALTQPELVALLAAQAARIEMERTQAAAAGVYAKLRSAFEPPVKATGGGRPGAGPEQPDAAPKPQE